MEYGIMTAESIPTGFTLAQQRGQDPPPISIRNDPTLSQAVLTASSVASNRSLHLYSPLGSPPQEPFVLRSPVGPTHSWDVLRQQMNEYSLDSPTPIASEQVGRRYADLALKPRAEPISFASASAQLQDKSMSSPDSSMPERSPTEVQSLLKRQHFFAK